MSTQDRLLAAVVVTIWGCNFVVIDLGLAGMPPLLFLAIRFTFVVFPAILFVRRPQAPWRSILLVGAFLSLGQFACLYLSLALGMPAGLSSLISQSQAVFTVILAAVLLKERPNRWQLVGLLVGFCGLVIVGLGREASIPVAAFIAGVGAALSWAIGNIMARFVGEASGLSMTVWSGIVVPIPALALALVVDGPNTVLSALVHLTLTQILSTAYTAGLASLVAYSIWNTLLVRYPAVLVVPYALLIPVIGIVAGWAVFREIPNVWELAGGVVLLVGVMVTTGVLRPRHRNPTEL